LKGILALFPFFSDFDSQSVNFSHLFTRFDISDGVQTLLKKDIWFFQSQKYQFQGVEDPTVTTGAEGEPFRIHLKLCGSHVGMFLFCFVDLRYPIEYQEGF